MTTQEATRQSLPAALREECDGCGLPTSLVGPLGVIEEWPEHCALCGKKTDAVCDLYREAYNLLKDWVEHRSMIGVSKGEFEEALDHALSHLAAEEGIPDQYLPARHNPSVKASAGQGGGTEPRKEGS